MARRRVGDLESFLEGLTPACRKTVLALRRVISDLVPAAEESVLWGGLSYHRPSVGGRVKGAVCQIHASYDEVRLEFIHGVRLPDPQGLLLGKRISKRFVPIHDPEDAGRPEIAALILAASRLDPAHWR